MAGRKKLDRTIQRYCRCGNALPIGHMRSQCRACQREYNRRYKQRQRGMAQFTPAVVELPPVVEHAIRSLSPAKQTASARVHQQLANPMIATSLAQRYTQITKTIVLRALE